MMAERGIALVHTTILRWVQRYVPDFDRLVEDAIAIAEGITVLPFGSKELAGYVTKLQATPVVAKIHGDVQLDTYNAAKEIAGKDSRTERRSSPPCPAQPGPCRSGA